jgi:hypothetical protein
MVISREDIVNMKGDVKTGCKIRRLIVRNMEDETSKMNGKHEGQQMSAAALEEGYTCTPQNE